MATPFGGGATGGGGYASAAGGGYGGGGYTNGGGGANGGGGYAGPSSPNYGSSTPLGQSGAGAAPSMAQQINNLSSEIGRIQASNPAPGSPTASYLAGLQSQLNGLISQSRAPAQTPQGNGSFARPGVQPAMQQDNNRSLSDLAMNGAGRNFGPMAGIGAAQTQAANVARGQTPTGQAIQAPTIEGPSQKSLYSFVPSAQNGQNPTGLDSNYLGFLQQVFSQNRQNPLMMGAGGGTNANQTGASGIRV